MNTLGPAGRWRSARSVLNEDASRPARALHHSRGLLGYRREVAKAAHWPSERGTTRDAVRWLHSRLRQCRLSSCTTASLWLAARLCAPCSRLEEAGGVNANVLSSFKEGQYSCLKNAQSEAVVQELTEEETSPWH